MSTYDPDAEIHDQPLELKDLFSLGEAVVDGEPGAAEKYEHMPPEDQIQIISLYCLGTMAKINRVPEIVVCPMNQRIEYFEEGLSILSQLSNPSLQVPTSLDEALEVLSLGLPVIS